MNLPGGSRAKLSRLYLKWDRYITRCWTLGAFGGRSKAIERLYERLIRLDYANRATNSKALVWEASGVWQAARKGDEIKRIVRGES